MLASAVCREESEKYLELDGDGLARVGHEVQDPRLNWLDVVPVHAQKPVNMARHTLTHINT